eukprot:4779339-Alexandrium_andersonii.AAC.1
MEHEQLREALSVLTVSHASKPMTGKQVQERAMQEWWAKYHIQQQKQIEADITLRSSKEGTR